MRNERSSRYMWPTNTIQISIEAYLGWQVLVMRPGSWYVSLVVCISHLYNNLIAKSNP